VAEVKAAEEREEAVRRMRSNSCSKLPPNKLLSRSCSSSLLRQLSKPLNLSLDLPINGNPLLSHNSPPVPSNQGYNSFASRLQAGMPLASTITDPYKGPKSSLFISKKDKRSLPTPPSGPHQGYYPSFNAAVNLAHALDVLATVQTLKTLEIPEIAQANAKRPRKRARTAELPLGEKFRETLPSIKAKVKPKTTMSSL
jgi:hypothetical protein